MLLGCTFLFKFVAKSVFTFPDSVIVELDGNCCTTNNNVSVIGSTTYHLCMYKPPCDRVGSPALKQSQCGAKALY